jgi:S1-C subfamily serine protease
MNIRIAAMAWALLCLLLSSSAHAWTMHREEPRSYHRPSHFLMEAGPQVYVLQSPIPGGGYGTGFQLRTKHGVVTVTNRHVCENQAAGKLIALQPGGSGFLVSVLHVSAHTDLCIVEGVPGARGLELADVWEPTEPVHVLGYPLGNPLTETLGVLLMLYMDIYEYPAVRGFVPAQTLNFASLLMTVPVWPGSSGSPVMNSQGKVVAVVWAVALAREISHAIPLSDLKAELKRAEKKLSR